MPHALETGETVDDPLAAVAEAASRGDAAAFERIVAATQDELYRLVARVTTDLELTEEVLQDGFLRAFAALRRGEFSGKSRLRTWLYRIFLNLSLDARRGRLRTQAREAQWRPPEPDSLSRIEARVQLRELARWLEALPAEQCAVLVLKEVEGRRTAEIAEILECTVGSVEQRLVRARAALRKRASDE